MRLVYEKEPNREVRVGDRVEAHNGGTFEVLSIEQPKHAASTGRVYVRHLGVESFSTGYFPGVIGAKWIEREDQR